MADERSDNQASHLSKAKDATILGCLSLVGAGVLFYESSYGNGLKDALLHNEELYLGQGAVGLAVISFIVAAYYYCKYKNPKSEGQQEVDLAELESDSGSDSECYSGFKEN